MSLYNEQRLTRLIVKALEAMEIVREGDVPYSEVYGLLLHETVQSPRSIEETNQ